MIFGCGSVIAEILPRDYLSGVIWIEVFVRSVARDNGRGNLD